MQMKSSNTFKSVNRSLDSSRKSTSVIDHKAYQHYIQNSKIATREEVANYVEHGKLISSFYKIVSEQILESKGGVYIKGFGYFGIMKLMKMPVKRFDMQERKMKLNTKNEMFNTYFVPISKNNLFRLYTFDMSFSRDYFKAFLDKINQGYRYMFNASLFYSDLRKVGAKI